MTIPVSNVVVTTDTFEGWIGITNQLCDAMSTRVITAESNTIGSTTAGNTYLNGRFSANVVIAGEQLRGGTVAAAANLTITTNTSITGANLHTTANVFINSGNTTINADSVTVQSGSVTITSNVTVNTANTVLLSPNILTIGANTLNITSNVSLSAANLISISSNVVSITSNTVTTTSNTTFSGALNTFNSANVNVNGGQLTVGSNVSVTGLTTLTGNTTLNGALQTIAGNVNFDVGTLFVDSVNNRVGIGNTTPNAPLTVTGAANVSGAVAIGGTTVVTGNTTLNGTLQTIAGNTNFDSGVLFVDSVNNRVGINNTTPDASLTIAGTANVSGATRFGGTVTLAAPTSSSNTVTITGQYLNVSTISYLANISCNTSLTATGNVAFTSNQFTSQSNVYIQCSNTYVDTAAFVVTGGTANLASNTSINGTLNINNSLVVKTDYEVQVVTNPNIGLLTGTPINIYTFDKATYHTARIIVQAKNGTTYQVSEILISNDETAPNIVVYGTVSSPAASNTFVQFTAGVVGANVELRATQTIASSSVKVVAHLIK